MASQGGRNVWATVWKNFVNSLRPRKMKGNLMGLDHNGTKYFEIPANPQEGKRHPSRWFVPVGGEGSFDAELPAEWEAWLRGRRSHPPTAQEVEENMRMMGRKRENAAAIETAFAQMSDKNQTLAEKKGIESFPKYDSFELHPGEKQKKV
ncbi:hypothetical protein AAG570_003184 [Ranatra chinensis]|uniref:NADH dehydrogenase [ubiquinone] 1 alpha subcomplex assembly factor 2 n=1 Tax=Ranatra chinensis TaxID=642074 RepID=A0ABD0YSS9_9HEMI